MSLLTSKTPAGKGLILRIHSDYGGVRSQQRGIRNWMIEAANQYGERSHKDGALLYTITDRSLRRADLEHLSDRLRGVCIVTNRDGVLLTCYRNRRIAKTGPDQRHRIKRHQLRDAPDLPWGSLDMAA